MVQETKDNNLKDNDLSGVLTYEPLYYISSFNSNASISAYEFKLSASTTISYSVNEFPILIAESDRKDLPECKKTESECSSISDSNSRNSCNLKPLCSQACAERNGAWIDTTCREAKFLRKICVLVKQNGNDWVPAKEDRMSNGCFYENEDPNDKVDDNYPAEYSEKYGGLILEVRHEEDPYVIASQITEGSYDFGMSQGQKTNIGLGLIVPGFTLAAIIAGGFHLLYKSGKLFFKPSSMVAPTEIPLATVQPQPSAPTYNQQSSGNHTSIPQHHQNQQQPLTNAPYQAANIANDHPPPYSALPEINMPEPNNPRMPNSLGLSNEYE